jgi:hypothetical protein
LAGAEDAAAKAEADERELAQTAAGQERRLEAQEDTLHELTEEEMSLRTDVASLTRELDEATATTTTTSTTSTVPPPPPAPDGSRSSPLPLGATARVGVWDVAVVAFTGDATAAILAENRFNDPPGDGMVYSLVTLRATYRGPGEEDASFSLTAGLAGDDQRNYRDPDCGAVEPNGLNDQPKVLAGGTVEGNFCLKLPASQLASGTVYVEETLGRDDETHRWWATSRGRSSGPLRSLDARGDRGGGSRAKVDDTAAESVVVDQQETGARVGRRGGVRAPRPLLTCGPADTTSGRCA